MIYERTVLVSVLGSWIFIAVPRPCDVVIPTLDASYPGGTTMHSDDNRCAIAKDFFNTNLELLQSVNYMPTSLLEIIVFGDCWSQFRFYGGYISVFLPCLRWLIAVWIPGVCWYQLGVIMGHLLRPCLTTYRVCDG